MSADQNLNMNIFKGIFLLLSGLALSSEAQVKSSIPEWENLKTIELPLFPAYSDAGRVFISIFKSNQSLSQSILDRLRQEQKAKKTVNFYVEGKIVEEILSELEFPVDSVFYIRSFSETNGQSIKVSEIRKLQIRSNNTQDITLGTIALETSLQAKESSRLTPVGLAWLDKVNPFTDNEIKEIKTEPSKLRLRTQHELQETVEHLLSSPQKIRYENAIELSANLPDGKLIEIQMPFERNDGDKLNLLGYFVRKADQIIKVHDFYFDDAYHAKPEKIFSGKILKNYKYALVFASMGMGQCGKLLLLKDDGTWVESVLHCGLWGC